MASPMSAIRGAEQLARRTVERKRGKPAASSRALRSAAAGKVAAAETPGAARRAHIETRDDAVSSRKPSRGKVSAGEVAAAQRAAAATRTPTPAMAQQRNAQRQAEAAAAGRDPSAGNRAQNAAKASDAAAMERVVREAAADGKDGPPRPAQDATGSARAASGARRKSLGAASPTRVRRTPRAAADRAAIQARNRAESTKRSDAPAPTRASQRARQTTAAAVSAAARTGGALARAASHRAKATEVESDFSQAAKQAGKSVARGLRASATEQVTGDKVRFAARVASEAVSASVQGLRAASGFTGRALSAREAGSAAKAVTKAIENAPQVAIDVATAGLRPK